ncbi:unnamed protein product [Diatraea saccharalis]|uniref:Protein kinase domain-containing protein n=1 Tax=Diatraea saccharalis TaxID=40085 RepID=A0A9N9W9C9_9NEOP|nr:unnamed protein product [Diatraea saccharalis]
MDPGSPSLLWPLRLSKPTGSMSAVVAGEHSKAEERSTSPALADRLAAAPSSPASPAPPSPTPPQHQFQAALVAEKYLLLEQVEGSSLCRCVDVRTQEEYVCKVVSRDCSSLLQAHYRLDGHPHVNPIHEVLVGQKRVYLIFPRSHSDLHSYVRARKRLREPEARRLFRQMAETVAACHEQGIVLRDLKLRKFVFADAQSASDSRRTVSLLRTILRRNRVKGLLICACAPSTRVYSHPPCNIYAGTCFTLSGDSKYPHGKLNLAYAPLIDIPTGHPARRPDQHLAVPSSKDTMKRKYIHIQNKKFPQKIHEQLIGLLVFQWSQTDSKVTPDSAVPNRSLSPELQIDVSFVNILSPELALASGCAKLVRDRQSTRHPADAAVAHSNVSNTATGHHLVYFRI